MRRFVAVTTFLCALACAPPAWAQLPDFDEIILPAAIGGGAHVTAGDFNVDGYMDVVSVKSGGAVKYWRGNTGLNWVLTQTMPDIDTFRSVFLQDIDGDTNLDIVATAATRVYIYRYNGGGFDAAYTIPATTVVGTTSCAGDLNADGKADLVVPAEPNWDFHQNLSTPGNISFMAVGWGSALDFGSSKISCAIGDFDGDGFGDVALGTTTSGIDIQLGDGTGSFTSAYSGPAAYITNIDATRDLFGDGDPDLFYGEDPGMVRWGAAGGAVDEGTNPLPVVWVGVGEFVPDTAPDFVWLDTNQDLYVRHNGSMAVWSRSDPTATGNFAIADFDGDTDDDILYVPTGGAVLLLSKLIPNCIPETCDGIDNDCDGSIDEDPSAHADCAMGEECHYGVCFLMCVMSTDCMGMDACYVDDGRCDDPLDPCTSITCQTGETCYYGSCFPDCTSHAMCNPANDLCYTSQTCRDKNDPCTDVQCIWDEVCYGGGCFPTCSDDGDCTPPNVCYNGRCADTACQEVDCPIDEQCYGGTCFQTCSDDAQCDPDHYCYNGRCAQTACQNVQCGSEQQCFGGLCVDVCTTSASCGASTACYGDSCLNDTDPCTDVQCGTSQQCYGGTCFDLCTDDSQCDPTHICYDGRCTDPDDPWCSGYYCENSTGCYRGDCFDKCFDDSECAADETCYDGVCLEQDCSSVTCEAGETCLPGVGACFQGCMTDADCDTAAGEGCYNNVCAQNACEAYDQASIDAYHNSNVFTQVGRRLNLTQYSTPNIWPRPVVGAPGVDFATWALTAGIDALQTATVVFYLDETLADGDNPDGKYVIWLTQGLALPTQGAAEATYSVRIDDWEDDEPDVLYNPNDEAWYKHKEGSDFVHFQMHLTSTLGLPTSIAFGPLASADHDWRVQIYGSFSGDLATFQIHDGELGEPFELEPREPVTITNPAFPDAAYSTIYEDSGRPCDRPINEGICKQGTGTICRNGRMLCDQTVFPWGFEICDGKDNTCDGQIDAEPIYYPIVYFQQPALGGNWLWSPTVDRAETVAQSMNYTQRGTNDRQGYTNFLRVEDGQPLQKLDHTWTFGHRDLNSGNVSIPIIHGAYVADSAVANDFGEWDREMRLWSPTGHNFDEFFVGWYDDRYPGGNSDDRIVDDFDLGTDFRLEHKVAKFVTVGNNLESDSAVIRPVWLEGPTGGDVRFNIKYENFDEDDDPFDWKVYFPRIGEEELEKEYSARIKVQGETGDLALCMSDTADTGGCFVSTYTCNAGAVQCQTGDDAYCGGAACSDGDGDGYDRYDPTLCPNGDDCNDSDPNVHPGVEEICNGLDDDCDGTPDHASNPGDMYGNCADGKEACGPAECNFLLTCSCPDGPEDPADPPSVYCQCGETLKP